MKKVALILIAALAVETAQAATTNLNYSAGQINTALGHALDNSNTVTRLDSLETFVAGSNGFVNIEYSTGEISNALAIAEANSNTVARLDTFESATIGTADIVITNSIVTNGFSSATFVNIDLSPLVGTNSALVLLEVEPTGSIGTAAAYFNTTDPGNAQDPYSGIGVVDLATGEISSVMCVTDGDGLVDVKSVEPILIRLIVYIVDRGQ